MRCDVRGRRLRSPSSRLRTSTTRPGERFRAREAASPAATSSSSRRRPSRQAARCSRRTRAAPASCPRPRRSVPARRSRSSWPRERARRGARGRGRDPPRCKYWRAIELCDALVSRILAGAAGLFGSTDAPRDPGIAYRSCSASTVAGCSTWRSGNVVREARTDGLITSRDALAAFAFAIEARLAPAAVNPLK